MVLNGHLGPSFLGSAPLTRRGELERDVRVVREEAAQILHCCLQESELAEVRLGKPVLAPLSSSSVEEVEKEGDERETQTARDGLDELLEANQGLELACHRRLGVAVPDRILVRERLRF